VTPVEFRGDLLLQKTRVPGLSCDVVCVILHFTFSRFSSTHAAVVAIFWANLDKLLASQYITLSIHSSRHMPMGKTKLHILFNTITDTMCQRVFTARCYASAVLAMALCPSVTSQCSTKTANCKM